MQTSISIISIEPDEEGRASQWSAPQWVCGPCARVLGGDRESASPTTQRALWRARRALEQWSLAPEGTHEALGVQPCDLCGEATSSQRVEAVIHFLPSTMREAS